MFYFFFTFEKRSAIRMREYKCFATLTVLYVTLGVTSLPLAYKLVNVGPLVFSGGALVVPFRFLVGDVLAEVYGYCLASKQIWNLLFAGFCFTILSCVIIRLPSVSAVHQAAYHFVLGKTIYITPIAAIGVLLGSNVNMYIIDRLRCVFNGRLFVFRIFSASMIGDLTQYAIILSLLYINILPAKALFHLVLCNYLYQAVVVAIFSSPIKLVTNVVKKIDNVTLSREPVSFNPFARALSE